MTITNGTGTWLAGYAYGGGMYILGSAPTINRCWFVANEAYASFGIGGAVYAESSEATFTQCRFIENSLPRSGKGGALACRTSTIRIDGCLFGHNDGGYGNAIWIDETSATLVNCTFIEDEGVGGYTLYMHWHSLLRIESCLLWGNTGREISPPTTSEVTVSYSNVDGGYEGEGNINRDPLLIDEWGHIGPGSPCIDAGNNDVVPPHLTSDLDGHARYRDDVGIADTGHGVSPIVDIGVYEYQASSEGLFTLEVTPSPIIVNEVVTYRVKDADAHSHTWIVYSMKGPSYEPIPALNVIADIRGPLRVASEVQTDLAGKAEWDVMIPGRVAGHAVYLQAFQQGRKSNVIWTEVAE